MKKSIILICFICLFIIVGCKSNNTQKEEVTYRSTTLHIQVKDDVNKKTLLDKEITVDKHCTTLADFLLEAKELQVEVEKGSYGTTIIGILGMKTEDFNKGPWWLYESSTNASCIKNGMCNAADQLEIQNNDHFVFTFTNSF